MITQRAVQIQTVSDTPVIQPVANTIANISNTQLVLALNNYNIVSNPSTQILPPVMGSSPRPPVQF